MWEHEREGGRDGVRIKGVGTKGPRREGLLHKVMFENTRDQRYLRPDFTGTINFYIGNKGW